jgi:hypothetical protein
MGTAQTTGGAARFRDALARMSLVGSGSPPAAE